MALLNFPSGAADGTLYEFTDDQGNTIKYKYVSDKKAWYAQYPADLVIGTGVLTLTQGGTSIGTFSANASANETIDIADSGGSVDSVNDQTGVVSLGIQDMNDVEASGAIYSWSTIGNPSANEDTWNFANQSGGIWYRMNTQGLNTAVADEVANLSVGDTVWVSLNNADFALLTVGDPPEVNTNWAEFWSDTSLPGGVGFVSPLKVAFSDPTQSELADGDILQWNDADQVFKPVQLPSSGGGGAVDSVNGETGVVEIGVEQLDDFALIQSVAGSQPWTWGPNTASPASGKIGLWSGNDYAISTITSEGTDLSSEIYTLLPADNEPFVPVKVFVNTALVYEGTWGNFQNKNNDRATFSWGDNAWTAGLNTGDDLIIQSDSFPGATYFPVVDGDILVYNGDDGTWNPQQPTGGGGTQSDWNVTDTADLAFIKNKPDIGGTQSDWNVTDTADLAFIKNKPDITDGAAATVTVGNTTTGAAGSSATVTNSGSTSAAVFEFTIPQGAQGAQGQKGVDGTTTTIYQDDSFPSGTRMLFDASNPPSGWTLDSSKNNMGLRVVNDSSVGGTVLGTIGFSQCFTTRNVANPETSMNATGISYTDNQSANLTSTGSSGLSTAELAQHRHDGVDIKQTGSGAGRVIQGGTGFYFNTAHTTGVGNGISNQGHVHGIDSSTTHRHYMGQNGGLVEHKHTQANSEFDLNLKYTNVVIGVKQ